MDLSRPVPWVSPVMYAAVLIAGLYAGVSGLGDTHLLLFAGGIAALFGLEFAQRHGLPAIGLLVARSALFVVVAAADGSGLSRALFVLVPFTAYFAFGRTVSLILGAACLGLVVAGYQLSVPGWTANLEHVSDLLMLGLGLVLAIAMASVAVEERTGRRRLEQSHRQIAQLSAAAERHRVARDIHDDLGHHLTAVVVLLEKADAFRERDPDSAQTALANAQRSARRALEDVRRSVRALHTEPEAFRLAHALTELVDGSIPVRVTGDESRYGEPVPAGALPGGPGGDHQRAPARAGHRHHGGGTPRRGASAADHHRQRARLRTAKRGLWTARDARTDRPRRRAGRLAKRERDRYQSGSDHSPPGRDMTGEPVRVLVVDDQQLVREGIASLLDIQDGIDVVGMAGDGREAVRAAVATNPDIVLMDVRMPEMDGVEAVAVLREQLPTCRVVMLTTFDDQQYVLRALRAGACGYLLKDLPSRELAAAVRLAHAGVMPLDPAATARIANAAAPTPDHAHLPLTPREIEVLRLVAAGLTNREIARRLHLSEGTVRNYLSRVLDRLGMRDRTQAAIYARDHGLL